MLEDERSTQVVEIGRCCVLIAPSLPTMSIFEVPGRTPHWVGTCNAGFPANSGAGKTQHRQQSATFNDHLRSKLPLIKNRAGQARSPELTSYGDLPPRHTPHVDRHEGGHDGARSALLARHLRESLVGSPIGEVDEAAALARQFRHALQRAGLRRGVPAARLFRRGRRRALLLSVELRHCEVLVLRRAEMCNSMGSRRCRSPRGVSHVQPVLTVHDHATCLPLAQCTAIASSVLCEATLGLPFRAEMQAPTTDIGGNSDAQGRACPKPQSVERKTFEFRAAPRMARQPGRCSALSCPAPQGRFC